MSLTNQIRLLVPGGVRSIVPYASAGAGTVGIMALLYKHRHQRRPVDRTHVVLVTGCDSGLGFNIALRCHQLNMFVVAACLDTTSSGAVQLRAQLDPAASRIVQLDLCCAESIGDVRHTIEALLRDRPQLQLSAVVNNAGVMCFGEFEWQTVGQFSLQIQVNLVGTMALTHALLPLCRSHGSRIIMVTSHCSLAALPGLAAYAASKAGLSYFLDGLRVEQRKYGVDIINFIPGSFVMSSNIVSAHAQETEQQRAALTADQWSFYGEYFERYHSYLRGMGGPRPARSWNDVNGERMMSMLEATLLERRPRAVYRLEPTWRYRIYHWLFSWTPVPVRDYLVERFMSMPAYVSGKMTEAKQIVKIEELKK